MLRRVAVTFEGDILDLRSTPPPLAHFKLSGSSCHEPFLIMDSHDAEVTLAGSVAVGRERRGRTTFLALLVFHTVLTGTCVVLCFYSRDSSQKGFQETGIYLNMIEDPNYNYSRLNFTISWNQSMELMDFTQVIVIHPGPYVFYICAVVQGKDDGVGNLTLNQADTKTSIKLLPKLKKKCRRQERLVSLYEKDVVTFSFERTHGLILKDLRVGLHLLGAMHRETPEELPD